MRFTRLLLLLAIPFYFVSCKSQQKLPNYLVNMSTSTTTVVTKIPELRIQKGDLLSIQIYSLATDPKVDQYWNLPMQYTGVGQTIGQGTTTGGFIVDGSGNIEHFRLGTIHAEGVTKQQLAAEIKKRLTQPVELLANPTVTIRFLNYQVTVMGEVAKTGTLIVPGENITILQAIGLSGDITQFGRKDSVKIVRTIDGKIETGFIDLSSKELFNSPYYHLLQNDMVMVDPGKIKAKSLEQAVVAQKVTFALTIATVAASIANIIINSSRN
ncbi:MAG: polysaccharide biosynthesis/export family protein [Chitinophagaceae bacterium]|nr:polysaccharide biosynthesis/export family protein [Chitinophagaceae bacterium]